jgi:hypothetical protein
MLTRLDAEHPVLAGDGDREPEATHTQYVGVRQHVRAAIRFLDWLAP